jgi:opacity protein-like surface antigen
MIIWGMTLICLTVSDNLLSQSFGWNIDAYVGYFGYSNTSVQADLNREFGFFAEKYGDDPEFKDFEITTPMPKLGISIDYFFSSRHGFKFDINVTQAELDLKNHSAVLFNDDFTEIIETGEYDHDFSSIRVSTILAYSFYLWFNDKIAVYTSAGVGVGFTKSTLTSTFPKTIEPRLPSYEIGLGVGIGARYFFTDHIGVNVSLGLGRMRLVNGGLSFNF